MDEKFKSLEKTNILESSKTHLIKFIENLSLKYKKSIDFKNFSHKNLRKNSEMEIHLAILMSFLEIKDPEKTTYLEMVVPKDRKKSSSIFKK